MRSRGARDCEEDDRLRLRLREDPEEEDDEEEDEEDDESDEDDELPLLLEPLEELLDEDTLLFRRRRLSARILSASPRLLSSVTWESITAGGDLERSRPSRRRFNCCVRVGRALYLF